MCARSAARDRALVAGAVGPLGVRLEPYGPTSKDEARAVFREQIEGLVEGGVDLFILETFARPRGDRAGDSRRASRRAGHAGHRADDDRRRRPHAVRRIARGRRARARPLGRRRHRTQLLRRPADDSRVHREDGAAHAAQAERAAERRHAARRRRPQHVHGEPRVHGDVRAPSRAGGRQDHRRLLRNDARAHPRDGRRHSAAGAATGGKREAASGKRRGDASTPRRVDVDEPTWRRAGSVRRALAVGGEARARAVRDVGRDRAAARRRRDAHAQRHRAGSRRRASTR